MSSTFVAVSNYLQVASSSMSFLSTPGGIAIVDILRLGIEHSMQLHHVIRGPDRCRIPQDLAIHLDHQVAPADRPRDVRRSKHITDLILGVISTVDRRSGLLPPRVLE